jgi:hypothetical protein
MHPWGFNLMAAFVTDGWYYVCVSFSILYILIFSSSSPHTLCAELGCQKIKGWNPDIVYHRLMALPVFKPGFNGSWRYPDSLLLLVMRETANHHIFL